MDCRVLRNIRAGRVEESEEWGESRRWEDARRVCSLVREGLEALRSFVTC